MSEETKFDMANRIHAQKFGNTERYSFSKIKNVLNMPNLVYVQKNSYNDFIQNGIKEVLQYYSPIVSQNGKLELSFTDYTIDPPANDIQYCKKNSLNYEMRLHANCRLKNVATGEIQDQKVFLCNIPAMTDSGSFVINGAERVIESQLIRSPGVYSEVEIDKKTGKPTYQTRLSPERGSWLEFEQDQNGITWVHINRKKKILTTILVRALGLAEEEMTNEVFKNYDIRKALGGGKTEDVTKLFGKDPMIVNTASKDGQADTYEALASVYANMKDNGGFTLAGARETIRKTFFEERAYDLTRVGRYKVNKKLSLASRIAGQTLYEDIIAEDGEFLASKGEVLSLEQANEIQNRGINIAWIEYKDANGNSKGFKVIGNNTVDLEAFVPKMPDGSALNPRDLGILEKVYYPRLMELMSTYTDLAELIEVIKIDTKGLVCKAATIDDIIATIDYNIGLAHGFGQVDDIDHLSNRRVRAVGELLFNSFRTGVNRLERNVRDKMQTSAEGTELTPQKLINIHPLESAIRTFFGSSQLSQFMDQVNPIAELAHKRKLSALGPNGLNRDRATSQVRDIHHSHYGRMCPIETPEGANIGLITNLATYARINEYGYIETPYRKINKETGEVTNEVVYMTAEEEDRCVIAQANEPLDDTFHFVNERVTCRNREMIREFPREIVDYMDVNPSQLVSISTALIPFLENDDPHRALMGANMQRQAVPLMKPDAPIIATGVESLIAHDSGAIVLAKEDGVVKYVDSNKIVITNDNKKDTEYSLKKFQRSNQNTCVNQHPIVAKGQRVVADEVIADGPATNNGELSLGKNILVGFMEWEGYNFEDAVLINEDLVKNDDFTSIHIFSVECEARETTQGPEEITYDIPNLPKSAFVNLDESGIVRIGATVKPGDILVGKVSPKAEQDNKPENILLRAIMPAEKNNSRDSSLRVKNDGGGVVVDVQVFDRADPKSELAPGVLVKVKVFIAQKRKVGVGDKMCGRHGNKGVVSRVLPREDMPFLEDGTPLQVVLSPLGVPSRMNIGQVLEVHLGLVAHALGWHVATPVFDGATEKDIKQLLNDNGFVSQVYNADGSPKLDADGKPVKKVDGKIRVFDGRTGEEFDNPVTVGYMYYIKLNHLVDDKIHARSTGKAYALVTQQPLGGKAQSGGQRLGEMEVWALEAYGAANLLQEVLTVKSDSVEGRNKALQSIIKGTNLSQPGVPESFNVLLKELRALALDVSVIAGNKEIALNGFEDSTFEYPRNKLETERREVDLKNLLDAAPQEIALDSSIFDTPEEDDSDLFANTDDNNEFDIQLPEFVSLDDEDDLPSLEDFGDELSEVLGTLENPSDEDDNY